MRDCSCTSFQDEADWKARALAAEARVKHLEDAFARHEHEVQQILGRALGYKEYGPDGPGNEHDVCVGDHVALSLVDATAKRIRSLEARAKAAESNLADAVHHHDWVEAKAALVAPLMAALEWYAQDDKRDVEEGILESEVLRPATAALAEARQVLGAGP